MNRSGWTGLIAGLGMTLAGACQRAELTGPPAVRLGRDQCAECGMLVSESRCSCALLVEQDGDRAHLVFDDIGCMLDFLSEHPETVVVDRFVRDYATTEWTPAGTACLLRSDPDALRTPMGSGIVTFAGAPGAEAQRRITGGEIVRFETLTGLGQGWQEARRAQTPGTP